MKGRSYKTRPLVISKNSKFSAFSLQSQKFFSITKTIFSHSRSEQFWKQNTKYVHILLFLFSKVFYGKIYAPKCVRWENNEEGSNIIMMRPLHAHTAVLFRFFLSKYIIMDFGKDSSTDKTFVRYHRLRTPNEGINHRNLKIWVDMADKLCLGST